MSHLRLWREEGAGHSVYVLWVDLDADIAEAHLMKAERARSGANVILAGIRRERDCVFLVTARQVVTDGAINIVLSVKGRCK